jgi:hypothetical protein
MEGMWVTRGHIVFYARRPIWVKVMMIVTVNRHIVARNRKNNERQPPLRSSMGRYGKPKYHQEIKFNGGGRLIYNPDKPLPCGATVWIEIDSGGVIFK